MTFEMLEEYPNAVLHCKSTVRFRLVLMIISSFKIHLVKNYTSPLRQVF